MTRPSTTSTRPLLVLFALAALALSACSDDNGGTAADRLGVGAQCSGATACATVVVDGGAKEPLTCLTQFSGGYCGLQGCAATADCPDGSICVHHTDGSNYCFRRCVDKNECNRNRSPENEANCSSSFTWATPSDDDGAKACIPPSSGI